MREIQIVTSAARNQRATVRMAEPFSTMIIDPPWPYTVAPEPRRKAAAAAPRFELSPQGRSGPKALFGFVKGGRAPGGYEVMSIEDLARLPVGDLCGGYVLLWTSMPFLPAALLILEEWGFNYITGMCWAKWDLERNGSAAQTSMFPDRVEQRGGGYGGVGFWFLGNHELILLGKKPHLPSIRTGYSSLVVAPKTRHSEKPKAIHELIEARFPQPYGELFARTLRPGWQVIGAEVDRCDCFEAIERRYGLPPRDLGPRFREALSALNGLTAIQKFGGTK